MKMNRARMNTDGTDCFSYSIRDNSCRSMVSPLLAAPAELFTAPPQEMETPTPAFRGRQYSPIRHSGGLPAQVLNLKKLLRPALTHGGSTAADRSGRTGYWRYMAYKRPTSLKASSSFKTSGCFPPSGSALNREVLFPRHS